jgi:hypothetical protein
LRASLQDLLFKHGEFRWNRLENLLNNARESDDYDVSQILNQALEYLFSERGDFIRDRIVLELVKSLDTLSSNAFANAKAVVGEWFGVKANQPVVSPTEKNNLEHIKRIWDILQSTPGFDGTKVLQLLPQLLVKPEVQNMGQKVVGGLAQRAVARLIREFLVSQEPAVISENGSYPKTSPQLSLPAAK